jgi:hypothetical protein
LVAVNGTAAMHTPKAYYVQAATGETHCWVGSANLTWGQLDLIVAPPERASPPRWRGSVPEPCYAAFRVGGGPRVRGGGRSSTGGDVEHIELGDLAARFGPCGASRQVVGSRDLRLPRRMASRLPVDDVEPARLGWGGS